MKMIRAKSLILCLVTIVIGLASLGCSRKIFEIENDDYKIKGYLMPGPITTRDAVELDVKRKSKNGKCDGRVFFADTRDSLDGLFLKPDLFLLEWGFHKPSVTPTNYILFNFAAPGCNEIEIKEDIRVYEPTIPSYDQIATKKTNALPNPVLRYDSLLISFFEFDIGQKLVLVQIRLDSPAGRSFLKLFVPYASNVRGTLLENGQILLAIHWQDGQAEDTVKLTLPNSDEGLLHLEI